MQTTWLSVLSVMANTAQNTFLFEPECALIGLKVSNSPPRQSELHYFPPNLLTDKTSALCDAASSSSGETDLTMG